MKPVGDGTRTFIVLAVIFEFGFALLGLAIAWVAGFQLSSLLPPSESWLDSAGWGLVATMPLLPVLAATLRCRWRPLVSLRRTVCRFVRRLFTRASCWDIAAVSLAAGLGEEILFRGAIQPLASAATTPTVGLVIASLLFGAAHAASWTYFWLATIVGCYLGWLTLLRGEIISAVVVHSLYDFVALLAISRGWLTSKKPLFTLPSSRPTKHGEIWHG